ncbi:MAG: glycosyltransferase family 2 protein [Anaerolineae bacterium]|nr:glycosyltransferase family 2 protein [Anaerolineae bacterium]
MSDLDLGIVIVNWNTRDLLRDCLRSVFASENVTFRVIVVDNASWDKSAEMVRAEFPAVEVIANAENRGFPQANNQGFRVLGFEQGCTDNTPRYALALNPDTVLPPSALADMVHYMDADATIGAAGPKLVMLDGKLDLACRRSFPTPAISFYRMVGLSKLFPRSKRFGRYNMTYLDPDTETEVDSVVGAFMLVRRAAIQRVGLFDESYFMYGEDLDWAYRIKQAGWKVMYNPQVTVTHVKRAASRQSKRAQTDFYRAMLIFYYQHYRATTAWPLHSLIMLGIAVKGGRAIWPYLLNTKALLTETALATATKTTPPTPSPRT